MKKLIFLFFFGLIISCSSSEPGNTPTTPDDKNAGEVVEPVEPAKDLSGLDVQEVISTKYNLLKLECQLWTQEGEVFIEGQEPDDSFQWDLINELDQQEDFELISKKPKHFFKMFLSFSPLEIIDELTLQPDEGRIIKLKFSPIIDLDYYYESQITFSEFPAPIDRGDGEKDFNEKLPQQIVDFHKFSSANPNHRFFERVTCLLRSEIKAQYQEQFKIETSP